jgi:hypothetical protein
VVLRHQIIVKDTLSEGQLTACKHANGRDWWLLINKLNTNKYYKILVQPNSIQLLDSQLVGEPVIQGLGQSKFSPNGNFYAVYQSISDAEGADLYLYKFD